MNVDVAIVGSGIVGLAHAYAAAKRGLSVAVIELTARPIGASIRNFGMIWPVGQPAGDCRDTALLSRSIWLEIAQQASLFHDPCGSLQYAFHEQEAQVIREFYDLNSDSTELLTPTQVQDRFPNLKTDFLQLALFSNTEVCVNPREALNKLPSMLQNQFGVQFFFDEPALKVSNGTITTTRQEISAQLAIICPGANFKILHPDFFTRHGLTQTTLQMLRAEPMNRERRLGTMLAGGLTLGHYASFESCPSILKLREFHQAHYQPYVERGIHVMASQHADPEITIGDTHVYGIDTPPFGEEFADELIMDYLAKMVSTEGWRITSRWQGTYSKHRDNPLLTEQLDAKTLIAPSPGGAGMTLSFGFAERNLAQQQLGQIIHV